MTFYTLKCNGDNGVVAFAPSEEAARSIYSAYLEEAYEAHAPANSVTCVEELDASLPLTCQCPQCWGAGRDEGEECMRCEGHGYMLLADDSKDYSWISELPEYSEVLEGIHRANAVLYGKIKDGNDGI